MDDQKLTFPVSLPQAIRANVDYALSKINTCMPGSIESYDPNLRRAHVRPLQKRILLEDGTYKTPVIPGVPVHFMLSSSLGGLRFDLKPGDTGLLLFSQRSLDEWLAQGGDVDPKDVRRFALSDAIFLPGLIPFTGTPAGESNVVGGLILDYGDARLRFNNGKIALGNSGAELLDIVDRMLSALLATTVPTAVGTYPLSSVLDTTVAQIKTLLSLIKMS